MYVPGVAYKRIDSVSSLDVPIRATLFALQSVGNMKSTMVATSAVLALSGLASASPTRDASNVHFHGPMSVTYDSLHNIHLEFSDDFEGHVQIVHGSCDMTDVEESHHTIGSTFVKKDARPDRFVWVVPEDAIPQGCLHAFSSKSLVGRSTPITVGAPMHKRQTIAEVAEATGPWFDGVAAMAAKDRSEVFVEEAKNKSIVIVGGGITGLATALFLDSVGVHNWKIVESSGRIGGRIRTKYLAGSKPEEYQYQELG